MISHCVVGVGWVSSSVTHQIFGLKSGGGLLSPFKIYKSLNKSTLRAVHSILLGEI